MNGLVPNIRPKRVGLEVRVGTIDIIPGNSAEFLVPGYTDARGQPKKVFTFLIAHMMLRMTLKLTLPITVDIA